MTVQACQGFALEFHSVHLPAVHTIRECLAPDTGQESATLWHDEESRVSLDVGVIPKTAVFRARRL